MIPKPLLRTARRLYRAIVSNHKLDVAAFIATEQQRNPRYADPKCLTKHEFKAFSQGGEDGIIAEIFRRIGMTNRTFLEVGVEDGLECNTACLLAQGWTGLWVEGSARCGDRIRARFSSLLESQQLRLENRMIGPGDLDALIQANALPQDLDLLSIDVDSIEFWLWQGLKQARPRVLVIEYNAHVPAHVSWTQPQDKPRKFDFPGVGASLKALELLGLEKGYELVGCGFTGCNAFFVRTDLAGDHFLRPSTAEQHFEPLRDFLIQAHEVE